jgi:hypothetical protein
VLLANNTEGSPLQPHSSFFHAALMIIECHARLTLYMLANCCSELKANESMRRGECTPHPTHTHTLGHARARQLVREDGWGRRCTHFVAASRPGKKASNSGNK